MRMPARCSAHRSRRHCAPPAGASSQQSAGGKLIRLGIVGCNYGRTVLLPAFRTDPRCEVVALAGTDAARTANLAREAGVPPAFGNWAELVENKTVDAVAIATPPRQQPAIAIR